MNRVYKLVWSKTKNMYVAVCEYAKSHTKSVVNKNVRRMMVVGVLFSFFVMYGGNACYICQNFN